MTSQLPIAFDKAAAKKNTTDQVPRTLDEITEPYLRRLLSSTPVDSLSLSGSSPVARYPARSRTAPGIPAFSLR